MKVGESYIFVKYLCYRFQNSIFIHPISFQKVSLYSQNFLPGKQVVLHCWGMCLHLSSRMGSKLPPRFQIKSFWSIFATVIGEILCESNVAQLLPFLRQMRNIRVHTLMGQGQPFSQLLTTSGSDVTQVTRLIWNKTLRISLYTAVRVNF